MPSKAVSEHTPGPWKLVSEPGGWPAVEVATKRIITVEGRTDVEAETNARLISKAWLIPEMVEVLKAYTILCTRCEHEKDLCPNCETTAWLLARYEETP